MVWPEERRGEDEDGYLTSSLSPLTWTRVDVHTPNTLPILALATNLRPPILAESPLEESITFQPACIGRRNG